MSGIINSIGNAIWRGACAYQEAVDGTKESAFGDHGDEGVVATGGLAVVTAANPLIGVGIILLLAASCSDSDESITPDPDGYIIPPSGDSGIVDDKGSLYWETKPKYMDVTEAIKPNGQLEYNLPAFNIATRNAQGQPLKELKFTICNLPAHPDLKYGIAYTYGQNPAKTTKPSNYGQTIPDIKDVGEQFCNNKVTGKPNPLFIKLPEKDSKGNTYTEQQDPYKLSGKCIKDPEEDSNRFKVYMGPYTLTNSVGTKTPISKTACSANDVIQDKCTARIGACGNTSIPGYEITIPKELYTSQLDDEQGAQISLKFAPIPNLNGATSIDPKSNVWRLMVSATRTYGE